MDWIGFGQRNECVMEWMDGACERDNVHLRLKNSKIISKLFFVLGFGYRTAFKAVVTQLLLM